MMGVLDTLESYNINSLIYHIRIMNDALYDTDLSPQSSYTSKVNYDEWDYLEWLIDEVHRRGMEFHAWLNPYRIQNGVQDASLIADKYVNYPDNPASNPDMILVGSAGAILNPGEPAVRDFVVDTSMEIIEKYDVDAIHFDDYFYITMEPNADLTTYNKYKSQSQTTNIEDWRREQVDLFIRDLSGEMRSYNNINNRQVQLGISPSGVWKSDRTGKGVTGYDANGNAITDGSNTSTTFEHYKSYLYSDTKKWIDEEWIDYILPQVYWGFQQPAAPYAALVDWWKDVVKHKDVNLYIGMGLYQLVANEKFWSRDPYEASKQVLYSNQYEDVRGITIYKYSSINSTKSNPGVMKIKNEYWNKPVLNPIIRTLNPIVPDKVRDANVVRDSTGFVIDWQPSENARKYAIYRNLGTVDYTDPNQLVGVVGVSPESNLGIIVDKVNSTLDYNYSIVPVSGTNHLGEPFIFNTKDKEGEPNFDFATMEDIWLSGSTVPNQEFQINWNEGVVKIGSDLVYETQVSLDQVNWTTITDGRVRKLGNAYAHYLTYPTTTAPIYYRVKARNEIGELTSNTIKAVPHINNINEYIGLVVSLVNEKIKSIYIK